MANDWFLALFLITLILRGLGAGIILGVELITLPARRRLDLVTYAQFMRAHYKGSGVKIYAGITILGFLLTLALAIWTFVRGASGVSGPILFSLLATMLGFVGTAGAYPAMRTLWNTPDDNTAALGKLLDRFASWGMWSTVSHIVAFIFLSVAITDAAS